VCRPELADRLLAELAPLRDVGRTT